MLKKAITQFGSRYMAYDPEKSYVIVDDSTLTEQSGYKTTTELYEEMVRAGKLLNAHRLGMSYNEYLDHEDEEPFELRYELDPVEQQEILDDYNIRLRAAAQKRLDDEDKNGAGGNDNSPEKNEQPASKKMEAEKS